MSKISFLTAAIRDYRVGALTPTSKYAVQKIVKALKPGYRTIIEYGAGDGVLTRALLDFLPPDGRLVAIEINEHFIPELQRIGDPRLEVREGDVVAESERLFEYIPSGVDAVISGIPFLFLNHELRARVVGHTYRALRKGGMFVAYQTSPLLVPYIKPYVSRMQTYFEPRNFPPYFILVGEKG